MFNRNKNSYRIVAVCKNSDKEGRYTFIDDYDEDWGTIASRMFYDEFGVSPTKMAIETRERI